MLVRHKEIRLSTNNRIELVNITRQVQKIVEESGIDNGICIIHVPHATASIIVNEDEMGLKSDIINWIESSIPWNGSWSHNRIDNNAASHIAASILGNSRAIPIIGGKLERGTWQDIFLLELDGPRSVRRVIITLIGE